MKKFKKFFAVLLTLAMVLGMSMTTFAATKTTGTITIKGLSANGETTINVYQAVSMEAEGNGWKWNVSDWAAGIIVPGQEGELTEDQKKLLEEVELGTPFKTYSTNKTSYTTEALPAGAYVITASTKQGDKIVANYSRMVVSTFETEAGNNTAKDATATAKVSKINLTKKLTNAADKVAAYGEDIQFTITTSVPDLTDATSYKIVDKPDGLTIKQVDSITGVNVPNIQGTWDDTTKEYTIDLSSLCGKADDMGKVITITYTATVTSVTGYSNTANSYVDDKKTGDDDNENGFTGSITVTKVDSDNSTPLSGAKFTVQKVDDDTTNGAKNAIPLNVNLTFTGTAGSYTYDVNGTVTDIEVDANGKVTINGLDGGIYHFTETKAPEGYQIADNAGRDSMKDAVLTEANATANITATGNYTNTKLSSLPSTGGIGTTIFTIGGCAIMIIAAGLFFASRRKSAK